MKCNNCGTEFDVGIFCPECGTKIETEYSLEKPVKQQEEEGIEKENTEMQKPEPVINKSNVQQVQGQEKKKGNAMETVALVFGIISLVTCGSGIVPGVIAIVCALQCKENGEIPSRAKTGMTCGMIGLIVFAILLLFTILLAVIGG